MDNTVIVLSEERVSKNLCPLHVYLCHVTYITCFMYVAFQSHGKQFKQYIMRSAMCPAFVNKLTSCHVACVGEAGYGAWSDWSPCNATCRSAYQSRNRTCDNEASGCTAESYQSKPCSVPPCPGTNKQKRKATYTTSTKFSLKSFVKCFLTP